jgi:hypothetical protein
LPSFFKGSSGWKEDLFSWVKGIQVRHDVSGQRRGWWVECKGDAKNTILMINIRERGKKWKRVEES